MKKRIGELASKPMREKGTTVTKNARWSRDELILALDLYMETRGRSLAKDAPEIEELSHLLSHLGQSLGLVAANSYRNMNGVYMKLMNFRRFDPIHAKAGKVGLARGNKDEEHVWKLFSSDPEHLKYVAQFIRNSIKSPQTTLLQNVDDLEIEEAEEGGLATRSHHHRERNRQLVKKAKARALKLHGRLFCVVCNFDFSAYYGDIGEGIIDVHHTKPIHTMQPGEKTKISDLVLLCANCHRIIHSRRKWLTVEEVRLALKLHEYRPMVTIE
ncbi:MULTISPECIES: HNH endonuclease [unclassified Herbaspirillum]|uniref:HNH endonuclease n=1 Tax=unclassified Herbaspirillum TaxID=2624150 RepID=UPI001174BE57|nr:MULTISPECIES: HNH endonuclease [unclassified Herbaspirillum]MBB5393922.1 5-methylcytosine-specific restriction protein A [Herbaspirillum sp. SJZ102]TQK00040.1 5-methylcytosine-specific restriction protein A [Herbaspirillum sp. SJZ130]TQK04636.1 5-methylcytosine-specific restriction protein A [Herbaspirillum sp. SJZ106]